MKRKYIITVLVLMLFASVFANPLPFAEISLVNSDPPQVGIKFYVSTEDSVILAGDTLITSSGPAIITPGGALDQPVSYTEIVILDSTNTSGFTINPEADSIRLSTLFWDDMPILFTEYLGNFGTNPAPMAGHQLDNDHYYYSHEQLMSMRVLSFDFCIPDMGWSDVIINEVNAHGTWNGGSDFIELYNKSDENISLAGWYLVCDTIYEFPENAVISGHGYYVVDQDDFPSAFDMDTGADNIYLISAQDDPFFDPSTKRRVDQVGWSSDHGENVSFMRYPDGDCSKDFMFELQYDFMGYDDQSSARTFEDGFPSPGAANRHESPGFTVIGASGVFDDTGLVEIYWTNPVWDASFARSILVKSQDGFSESPEDGTILYEGTAQHYIDTVIPYDTHTHYTIFAVNQDEELSTPTDESQIDLLRATDLQYLVGDANMKAGTWPPAVIGSDVTYLVNYFRGGMPSPACLLNGFYASADVNGDCHVIGSDVTRLVNFFRGSATITGCPDYPSEWSSPMDLPTETPEGWPNCEE